MTNFHTFCFPPPNSATVNDAPRLVRDLNAGIRVITVGGRVFVPLAEAYFRPLQVSRG